MPYARLPHCFALVLSILGLALLSPGARALDLTFTNQTGVADSDLYVWFQQPLNANFLGTGNVVHSQASYSLAEIGAGIDLHSYVGGRIFVSVGAPFPVQTNNAQPPQFNQSSPPAINNSFNNRHQLIGEITLTPAAGDTANLTNIDWVSMPAAMRTFAADGTQLKRIGFADDLNVNQYLDALSALTNRGARLSAGTNAPGNPPTATSQTGATTQHPQAPAPGSEVRILAPTSNLILEQLGKTTYPSFRDYVANIHESVALLPLGAPIATLEGRFFSGAAPTYHFTVDSIAAPSGSAPAWSLGQVTLSGTLSDNPGQKHTIVIPFESFSDTTIYGGTTGSPSNQGGNEQKGIGYYLDGVLTDGGANTAFTLPVRDFFAGLNYGYINSTVLNPNDPGNTYGASASQYWGGTNLITNLPQIFQGFDEVQPDHPYYNSWANVVHDYSHGLAYGFAYDDVFAPVSIGVVQQGATPVARLDIVLLAHSPTLGTPVPELGPGTLLLAAAAVGCVGRFRRRAVHSA